jgi:hypothetical protein
MRWREVLAEHGQTVWQAKSKGWRIDETPQVTMSPFGNNER